VKFASLAPPGFEIRTLFELPGLLVKAV
jgi:hypothetical protein